MPAASGVPHGRGERGPAPEVADRPDHGVEAIGPHVTDAEHLPACTVMRLQASVGNAAVTRMLARNRPAPPRRAPLTDEHGVQRWETGISCPSPAVAPSASAQDAAFQGVKGRVGAANQAATESAKPLAEQSEKGPDTGRTVDVPPKAPTEQTNPGTIGQPQRTTGNRQIQWMLAVQPAPNASTRGPTASSAHDIHAQVAEAVTAQDPGAVQRIMDRPDFGRATEAEILSLIRIVNSLGGGDPRRLGRLWDSFGERAPAVIAANMADWETTARLWPGVPDLVGALKRTEQALVAALRSLAEFNLRENEAYVRTRLEQLGYAPGAKPLSAEEQRSIRVSMQKVAYSAWQLRQTQEKARRTEVGRTVGRVSLPVTFDPAGPHAHDGPAEVDVPKWEAIKAEWDTAQTQLNEAAGKYPEIYELLSRRDDNALLNFSRVMPEDAANPEGGSANAKAGQGYQSQGKELLISLRERVQKAKTDLPKIDVLALRPLHERVYAAPGRWNHGFDQWVAKRAVERHARDENTMKVLANMGTGAAALVEPWTGGMALAFAAIGAGTGIATAAVTYAEAGRLDTLAARRH